MRKSESAPATLTEAEKEELLVLARSAELRADLRSTVEDREISFDDYVAFATSVARFANHPRRPFRPPNDSLFKL